MSGASLNICLIRPPTLSNIKATNAEAVPPLGLAYIARVVQEENHELTIVDAAGLALSQYNKIPNIDNALLRGLSLKETAEKVPMNTDIVGVTCTFSAEWPYTREVIQLVREKLPNSLIVLGGEHGTALPDFSFNDCPELDVCVMGEGEITFREILRTYSKKESLENIAGLVFRDKTSNKIIKTPTRPRIKDVDSISPPLWSVFPVKNYLRSGATFGADLGYSIPIIASRGCPYKCTFCTAAFMWTPKYYIRKPENVIAEMKEYIRKYRISNFDFFDLTAIIHKKWILEFCNLIIKENLNITWQLPVGTRSETIDEEVTKALYRSGCRTIAYAPESGSREELKRIDKRVNLKNMLKSIRSAYKAGLHIKINMITGLPESNLKDVIHTFGLLAKLAWVGTHDVGTFPYSPHPGSKLFRELNLELNEDYFQKILNLTSPLSAKSYTKHFKTWQLQIINISEMVFFYSLSFIFRPIRPLKLIYALVVGDNSTRITKTLDNVKRKQKAVKLLKSEKLDSVFLSS